jgi:hypothetical protein
MHLLRKALAPATALAAMLALAAPPAVAQQQPAAPAETLSEEQLAAFADAALDVQRVRAEFDGQMQAAESPEEAARLQQEAQEQATEAVESQGLTAGEYTAIAQAANQDPTLYATIVELMQERATE